MPSRGRFITFEGGEGAGKSTQVKRLAATLRAAGIDCVETREPGGAPGAEEIRRLLVIGEVHRWDPATEALLHMAARREHLVRTVWPALEAGRWVISDRFADSTMAYQGYGHGADRTMLGELYDITVGDFCPDLTLILDLPVKIGLTRAAARRGTETRYESLPVAFHERVRAGFRDIAAIDSERCVVIDASRDIDTIAVAIAEAVAHRLDT